mmetsp:Transcript_68551/g.198584  ORF Transcript_68551/g.198584 Transcript_68551/m.198584 type:complete len:101 (+) Transcript_68551:496-798(+)
MRREDGPVRMHQLGGLRGHVTLAAGRPQASRARIAGGAWNERWRREESEAALPLEDLRRLRNLCQTHSSIPHCMLPPLAYERAPAVSASMSRRCLPRFPA